MATKSEVLAELRRELVTRQRLYPDWVSKGKIPRSTATHRIATLEQAIKWIEVIEDTEPLQTKLF